MPQVVGKDCVFCGERIATILDGALCATCGCPAHSTCVVATRRLGACQKCGAAAELVAVHRPRVEREIEDRAVDLRAYHQTSGIRAFVIGLGLVLVGVLSILTIVRAIDRGGWYFVWGAAPLLAVYYFVMGFRHVRAARAIAREARSFREAGEPPLPG